jgi:hypothetical protein
MAVQNRPPAPITPRNLISGARQNQHVSSGCSTSPIQSSTTAVTSSVMRESGSDQRSRTSSISRSSPNSPMSFSGSVRPSLYARKMSPGVESHRSFIKTKARRRDQLRCRPWFYVLSVLAASTIPLESRQRVRRERTRIPVDLLGASCKRKRSLGFGSFANSFSLFQLDRNGHRFPIAENGYLNDITNLAPAQGVCEVI